MKSRKIKILYLITSLNIGGAEKVLHSMVNNLKEKYEIIVCLLYGGGKIEKKIKKEGINIYVLNEKRKLKINPISSFIRLFKIIKNEKPEIIHSFLFQANIFGRVLGKVLKVPISISTVRASKQSMGWQESLYAFFEKITWNLSDLIIAVSQSAKEYAANKYGANLSKIKVIHNGVDTDFFQPKFSLAPNRTLHPVVGAVGRLCPAKGYEFFLSAAKSVVEFLKSTQSDIPALSEKAQHREVSTGKAKVPIFWIVGDGKLRKKLEKKADLLGISENINFLGMQDDVRQILFQIDIYVISSVSEGFSNTLLEAMAMEKPVIATSIPSNMEVVIPNETGILVPPSDSDSLAKAIISFLRELERAKTMGKRGRERIISYFTKESMIKKTEEIYQELIYEKKIA